MTSTHVDRATFVRRLIATRNLSSVQGILFDASDISSSGVTVPVPIHRGFERQRRVCDLNTSIYLGEPRDEGGVIALVQFPNLHSLRLPVGTDHWTAIQGSYYILVIKTNRYIAYDAHSQDIRPVADALLRYFFPMDTDSAPSAQSQGSA
ncbi:hypothetical protein CC1G_14051 [Coprinopsis cinerea okayama7|uniref:Uncharacterized protein n=1 Tax=Coprinopsis cinerea (strain Okayama-7 / 130 / ATCC MYA-4618 / FGSC 9003) TaxID=240176 RepID=D6RL27_COPC7|nr:hypothetical protein CC1G_14051 [Coprinopsis cinerea okayama7\|eukprot:XP_002912013.1 hypothetical protein CC1G_14051 [Coprinopsis cinerea okayama7\